MSHGRARGDVPLNPPDPPLEDVFRQLGGEEAPEDQDAILSVEEVADPEAPLTGTELEHGYADDGEDATESPDSVEALVDIEQSSDETNDPWIASDEAIPYVPPTAPRPGPDEDPSGSGA